MIYLSFYILLSIGIKYAILGFIFVPLGIGYVIRRTTIASYTSSVSSAYDSLKTDFMLGSVLFHAFSHLVIEGFLFDYIDRYLGTALVGQYNEAVTLACQLFVTNADASDDNGLVITPGEGENAAIPKALFVPPYTVHEVQAMRRWDHLDSEYVKPCLRVLVKAVLSAQLGSIVFFLLRLYNISLQIHEVIHFLLSWLKISDQVLLLGAINPVLFVAIFRVPFNPSCYPSCSKQIDSAI